MNRLRTATPRRDADHAIARMVLLANFGRYREALDQISDAISLRPGDVLLIYSAWLRLLNPADGQLTVAYAEAILSGLIPVFESPPNGAPAYYVRALAYAAAGRWEDARSDVKQIVKFVGNPPPPSLSPQLRLWLMHADGSTLRFLHANVDMLWLLPTPVELRISVASEVVRRAGDAELCRREGVEAKEAAATRGWTNFRLAKFHAEKSDRDGVLKHSRAALAERVDDLHAGKFREDELLRDYNTDPDFVRLYMNYPAP